MKKHLFILTIALLFTRGCVMTKKVYRLLSIKDNNKRKEKMKLFIFCVMFILFTVHTAISETSTNYDTQKKESQVREKTVKKEKSISFKNITSTKSSTSRKVASTVEITLDSLIFAEIAKLEIQKEPFLSCKLISKPPLVADFGLTAEVDIGIIDIYKAEYLSKAAQSNISVAEITNPEMIKQYAICIAQYADVIAFVLKNINRTYNDITELQKHIETLVKNANNNSNLIEQIRKIDFSKACRFADEVNKIQCN